MLLITLAGCSSGSGDRDAPAGADEPPQGVEGSSTISTTRLKTRTIDSFLDDRRDETQVYEYDEAGRVSMHTIEDPEDGARQVIVYEYDADGNLVSKTDGVSTDSYSYEDARPVAARREINGMLTYRYDADGRLAGVTGEGFDFDDDCVGDFEARPLAEFEIVREDGRIVRIIDTVNGNTTTVTRDSSGRLHRVVRTGDCYDSAPQMDEYTYDDQGRLVSMFIEGTGFRDVNIITHEFDGERLVEVTIEEIDRSSGESTVDTVTRTFDDQGQLESELVTSDGVDAGMVRYTYEPGSCIQSGSADPSNVLNVESATLQSGRTPALRCGYWYDERDF